MGMITNLTPINLEEEKQKFFESNYQYNPQFIYNKNYSVQKLSKYGLPQEHYYLLAHDYLKLHPMDKKIKTSDEPHLSLEDVKREVNKLCLQLGIKPVEVVVDKTQNSRFAINTNGEFCVRWPMIVTLSRLREVLDHELQTHYLRRLNDEKQPWHADTTKRAVLWKRTEEGLAVYNAKGGAKSDLRLTAHLYLMVYLAQHAGFVEIFQQNLAFFNDTQQAFYQTVRVKRGLTDTSQPGGFTKDVVYWEGYHQVKDWLSEPTHSLRDLYWGKIGTQEVEELRSQAVTEGLVYPTFIDERR